MKKHSFLILVGALALVLAAVTAFALMPMKQSPRGAAAMTAGLEGLGGSWSLTDHNGKAVTDKNYTGRFRLMFFGFTYCPDVCPTELKRLTLVLEGLGADAAAVTPLFVTIDPERDTPDILKDYLGRFDPRFTGLTGSVKQIEHMETIYKVYAAKAESADPEDYLVNHSALVYLIGPDDKVIHLFHSGDTPDEIVTVIRQAMNRS